MISNQKLSRNFTLHELLRSDTAERYPAINAKQYDPPTQIVDNLTYLSQNTLQPIRSRLRFPISVSSGWRSPALNKKVGGAETSQHIFGEAADLSLSTRFISEDYNPCDALYQIENEVHNIVGERLRPSVTANFYLFAFIVIHLDDLDIDQVIHEYGSQRGKPAWVHVAVSRRQNKREIMCIGHYGGVKTVERVDKRTALSWGCRYG